MQYARVFKLKNSICVKIIESQKLKPRTRTICKKKQLRLCLYHNFKSFLFTLCTSKLLQHIEFFLEKSIIN